MGQQTLYNEIEPYAASWLENLEQAGHIAPGSVNRASIRDLTPEQVQGLTQFHTFAGIGVWSYALRLAGWPDDRPVWTGSCPCQPFSAAGKRKGFNDDRHLWPAWFNLIQQCRPAVIFGEQVASPDGLNWFDTVSADLENAGYSVGAADLCAAGVGAPHLRQRLFFVAFAREQRREGLSVHVQSGQPRSPSAEAVGGSPVGSLANTLSAGRSTRGASAGIGSAPGGSSAGDVVNPHHQGSQRWVLSWDGADQQSARQAGLAGQLGNPSSAGERGSAGCIPDLSLSSGPTNGFWAPADWLYCRDGKYRPVEPGTFPLANGAPSRVGRLRAYGNAINPYVAATFIRACM